MKKFNKEKFIEKANNIYKNKFNYDKFVFKGYKIKSIIICPIHGVFFQTPSLHLESKYACPKCALKNSHKKRLKYDTKSFIEKANKIHKNKYDYSKTIYNGTQKNIKIICLIHGEFELKQSIEHISSNPRGCPKCSIKKRSQLYKLSKEELKNKLRYNDYDYSLIEYNNMKDKVKIICKKHNLIFEQSLDSHINKNARCPKCATESNIKIKIDRTEKVFIKKREEIHGNKYDYSKFIYRGIDNNGIIICPIHGNFLQDPYHHINRKQGCPACSESYGEDKISVYLKNNDIEFIRQKRFKDCKDKKPLPFDFYLSKYNICIEYDGQQHYRLTNRIGKKVFSEEESKKMLEIIQKHDNIKNEYCNLKNIDLLRISYVDFNNIESILSKKLFNF